MNLRSTLCVVTAVVAGGLMGCGEPQKYYRVVVDRSPLTNLPSSCYPNNTPPPQPQPTSNLQDVQQWILWDGLEGRKYLEAGSVNYSLAGTNLNIGNDAIVSTPDADKTTFVAERTDIEPGRTYRATYTFDNEGGLFQGNVIEGSIALSYTCTPTGTFTCNRPNCEATLRFSGRQVEAEPMILVGSGVGAN
ncbi:MAG TPA: hypothetical protein VK458_01990 [Myxococcaceae bacterium]|nr:hypothetical protein [Myxococcaceae bacterium]